jgi:cyanophycinase
MLEVERGLLAGRPPRYVQIPTAAAREGEKRLGYWVTLGQVQAARLGVEAVPLVVHDRTEADDPAVAAQVAGAGLIYLSGGNPSHLADSLRDSALWRAIRAEWESGAALAGCSAGAMALPDQVPGWRRLKATAGLGALPGVRVLPHFDRMAGRAPDVVLRAMRRGGVDGVTWLGIDEDTALVGGPEEFTVQGRQSAWVLRPEGREELPAGSTWRLPPR